MENQGFEVDTVYLHRDAQKIREYLAALDANHKKLQTQMEALSGMWEGKAKEAFHARFASDSDLFQTICKELEQNVTNMEDAAREYDACEAEVKSTIDSIRL